MNENVYLQCRVWAWVAWSVMGLFLLAGTLMALIASPLWRLAMVLLVAALATSAVAATLHIRSFMVRVCSLVRAASYRNVDGEGLRPVG